MTYIHNLVQSATATLQAVWPPWATCSKCVLHRIVSPFILYYITSYYTMRWLRESRRRYRERLRSIGGGTASISEYLARISIVLCYIVYIILRQLRYCADARMPAVPPPILAICSAGTASVFAVSHCEDAALQILRFTAKTLRRYLKRLRARCAHRAPGAGASSDLVVEDHRIL